MASTGIIGVQLDASVHGGRDGQGRGGGHSATADPLSARRIMTTDRFPKECASRGRVTQRAWCASAACAKGAGMIAPAMATMLCVVTTDAVLEPDETQSSSRVRRGEDLQRGHGGRGDEHQRLGLLPGEWRLGAAARGAGRKMFAQALRALLHRLALMMVADGEGSTKIMRVGFAAPPTTRRRRACAAPWGFPSGEDGHARRRSQLGPDRQFGGRSPPRTVAAQGLSPSCAVKVFEDASARDVPEAEWDTLAAG